MPDFWGAVISLSASLGFKQVPLDCHAGPGLRSVHGYLSVSKKGNLPLSLWVSDALAFPVTGQKPLSGGAAGCWLAHALPPVSRTTAAPLEGTQGPDGELRAFFDLSHPTS